MIDSLQRSNLHRDRCNERLNATLETPRLKANMKFDRRLGNHDAGNSQMVWLGNVRLHNGPMVSPINSQGS